ncbi:hypothetical protein B0H14DRAFT_2563315 [Mycena olivaceomarginata]|nr:hypothetical protein B0H14DRAFT_2563315 [Mycena olivaceomarginata]
MFGNGYWIHNSNFYNVGGDVNLDTHHNLTIHNEAHAPGFQLLSASSLGFEDDRAVRHQHLAVQDYDPYKEAFQPPVGPLEQRGRATVEVKSIITILRVNTTEIEDASSHMPVGRKVKSFLTAPIPNGTRGVLLIGLRTVRKTERPSKKRPFLGQNIWKTDGSG